MHSVGSSRVTNTSPNWASWKREKSWASDGTMRSIQAG